jgi:hypothetical protein
MPVTVAAARSVAASWPRCVLANAASVLAAANPAAVVLTLAVPTTAAAVLVANPAADVQAEISQQTHKV